MKIGTEIGVLFLCSAGMAWMATIHESYFAAGLCGLMSGWGISRIVDWYGGES